MSVPLHVLSSRPRPCSSRACPYSSNVVPLASPARLALGLRHCQWSPFLFVSCSLRSSGRCLSAEALCWQKRKHQTAEVHHGNPTPLGFGDSPVSQRPEIMTGSSVDQCVERTPVNHLNLWQPSRWSVTLVRKTYPPKYRLYRRPQTADRTCSCSCSFPSMVADRSFLSSSSTGLSNTRGFLTSPTPAHLT